MATGKVDTNPTAINILKLQRYNFGFFAIEEVVFYEYLLVKARAFGYKEFYHSTATITKETGIRRSSLDAIIKKFVALGILNLCVKGFPKVKHFTVDFNTIYKLLPKIYQFAENSKLYAENLKLLVDFYKPLAEINQQKNIKKNNQNNKEKEGEEEPPLPLFFSKEEKERQADALLSFLKTKCPDFVDKTKFPKCITPADVEQLTLDFPGADGFDGVRSLAFKLYGKGVNKNGSVSHELRVWIAREIENEWNKKIAKKLTTAKWYAEVIRKYQKDPEYKKQIDENGPPQPAIIVSMEAAVYLKEQAKAEANLKAKMAQK